jgi:hypothetical protein
MVSDGVEADLVQVIFGPVHNVAARLDDDARRSTSKAPEKLANNEKRLLELIRVTGF